MRWGGLGGWYGLQTMLAMPERVLLLLQTIVRRMSGELDRFQRERAAEMGYVLRDYSLAQARLSGDTARLWGSLVPGMAA
mgnify:CR=1 FL=1